MTAKCHWSEPSYSSWCCCHIPQCKYTYTIHNVHSWTQTTSTGGTQEQPKGCWHFSQLPNKLSRACKVPGIPLFTGLPLLPPSSPTLLAGAVLVCGSEQRTKVERGMQRMYTHYNHDGTCSTKRGHTLATAIRAVHIAAVGRSPTSTHRLNDNHK